MSGLLNLKKHTIPKNHFNVHKWFITKSDFVHNTDPPPNPVDPPLPSGVWNAGVLNDTEKERVPRNSKDSDHRSTQKSLREICCREESGGGIVLCSTPSHAVYHMDTIVLHKQQALLNYTPIAIALTLPNNLTIL